MPVPETRARRSKATFCWTLFRFLRKKNHNAPRPTIATNPIPPTTPPAIAPALDFELPELADEGLDKVLDEGNGLEAFVLVDTADEEVKVSLATNDQEIRFHRSQPKLILHLRCSAADMLKLLFVYEEKFNLISLCCIIRSIHLGYVEKGPLGDHNTRWKRFRKSREKQIVKRLSLN